MSKLLYRLGHWAVRHRRRVVLGWLALFIAVIAASSVWGGSTSDVFEIPGTESQEAADLLDARFPEQSGSSARIVFASEDGTPLADGPAREAIDQTIAAISDAPGVVGVVSPFDAGTVSPEGDIAFTEVQYGVAAEEVPEEDVAGLEAAVAPAEAAGIHVEFGGDVGQEEEIGHTSELIGLGVAVLVLLFSFGSVVAMGLPIASALLGVGIGLTGITLAAGFTDLSSTAPTLAMMIGLAVGIDYALFIVTRHRQNLAEGHSVEESAARANATAGGAVVFAGMTVVIALAGLTVIGIPFLTVMGLAAAVTVFLAVLIAITMLPALLGFAGHNIDRWRIGRARTGSAAESHATLSARWARRVIGRPGVALVGGLAIMLLLAIPALSMRLGMPDDGSQPESTTRRQAYDLLAEGFGPGFNGPFLIVVDTTDAANPTAAVAEIAAAIGNDGGVLEVDDPQFNESGDTATLNVIPRTSPSSPETEDLVHRLRHDVLDPVEDSTGATASVAGQTASLIDVSDKMTSALPLFMALVIGLTMLLAIPALSMRLGMPDDGSQPESTTRRQAYDLLAEGFGPGFNGPFLIVVDTTDTANPTAAVAEIAAAIGNDSGVLEVGDPQFNESGDTATLNVIPRTSPSSPETEDLVHRLRHDVLDPVEDSTGATASVAGQTASLIDVSDKMTSALPLFMALVIGLTMLLLLVVFRSILVPIKAAIAILLSIASSFGVIVAVFQWGWLKDVIGLQETIPIISFLPMLMFAILFGLSMDYEVFILSRVREDYVHTKKARQSVLTGLTSSARVITAAALIMISVFASFILGDDPTIKMFGLGFSIAVLLDATVVRMMIVPAVMALFGDRAWWLPRWLDRLIPDLDVEGQHLIEQLDGGEAESTDDVAPDDVETREPVSV